MGNEPRQQIALTDLQVEILEWPLIAVFHFQNEWFEEADSILNKMNRKHSKRYMIWFTKFELALIIRECHLILSEPACDEYRPALNVFSKASHALSVLGFWVPLPIAQHLISKADIIPI